jgi:hypothetical protein
MRFLHVATLLVVAVLIAIALALWWAGFAPFPTSPVLLASYQEAGYCTVPDNNWADCSPNLPNTNPEGSAWDFRVFTDNEKPTYGLLGAGYGQWGVEGFNGCWDEGCSSIWHDPDIDDLRWKIYYDNEVPHFGLGRPRWVVMLLSRHPKPLDGGYAESTFTTYAACMYRKPVGTNTEWYQCLRIDPKRPWVVGKIKSSLNIGHQHE